MTSKPMFESLESRVLMDADPTTVWVIDSLDHAIMYNADNPDGTPVATSNLVGGDGDDVFVFANNTSSLSGTIDGGGGNNTIHYGAYSHPTYGDIAGVSDDVSVNLATGEATGVLSFTNINSVVGGSGDNELIGPDAGTVWAITGQNSGSLGGGFSFENFNVLTGGAGADDFFLGQNGTLFGSLSGGGGNDSLDFSAINTNLTWRVTSDNGGYVGGGSNTVSFEAIENLTGGQKTDTFIFSDGAGVDGTVDGGSGTSDKINGLAYTTNLNWNITGPNAGSFEGGSFISIENITSGNGNDTFAFVGPDARLAGTLHGGNNGVDTIDMSQASSLDRTWNFLTSSTGNMVDSQGTTTLTSIEKAFGGSGNDTFIFTDSAATNRTLQGGDGINTLNLQGYSTDIAWNLTSDYAGSVGTVNGTMTFNGMQQLVGGQAIDTFIFADQAAVDSIDGQNGNDILNLQSYTTSFQVVTNDALAGNGQANVGSPIPQDKVIDFQSIQTVQDNTHVAGQFGRISGKKSTTLTVQDSNGIKVTFALSGAGVGTVIAGPTFLRVELTGTNINSTLTITTPKGTTTTLFGISSDSSLGNIVGKTTNLAGEIYVNGSLRSATMANATAGAFVNVLGETTVSSLTFGRVQDMSVTLAGGLKTFGAIEWLNTDGKADTFTADWVNSLVTKGAKDNKKTPANEFSAGNFQAGLNLTGQGASRYTLNTANIAGSLSNANWSIDGNVNSIRSNVAVTGWALEGFSAGITGVNTLNLGDVQSANVTVNGNINSINTQRWLSGTLNAGTVKTLNVSGKKATRTSSPVSGDFQAAVNLSGPANPNLWTVSSAYIAGNLNNSAWNVTGKVNSFRVLGTAQSSRLQTTGDIRTLNLGATDGSDFLAGVNKAFAGRYSDNRSDFVNPSAKIGTVNITGIKGAVPAMPLVTDSHFTAAGFNGVNFVNAEFSTVGLHVLGGESNIRFIRHTDKANRSNNWTWKPGNVPPNYTTEPLISAIA